jgi:hypothetical protein
MTKAFVDTTVLTNALLKPGADSTLAKAALASYSETQLPVYAIKEFKAGPLNYYIWLHNKLATTKSLEQTLRAIADVVQQPNRAKTALLAIAPLFAKAASSLQSGNSRQADKDLADSLRLSLQRLIFRGWQKRRKLTSSVVLELACYDEADPILEPNTNLINNAPRVCRPSPECCLARGYRNKTKDLEKLLAVVQNGERREDIRIRRGLHTLINTPKRQFGSKECRNLGDVFFAFHCPMDSVILTTNLKDHAPLAQALGKSAKRP